MEGTDVYSEEPCYTIRQLNFQKGEELQTTCDKEAKEEDKEVDNKDGCLAMGSWSPNSMDFRQTNTKDNQANEQKTETETITLRQE